MELSKEIGGVGASKFAHAITALSTSVTEDNAELRSTIFNLLKKVEKQQDKIDEMEDEVAQNKRDIQTLVQLCLSLVGNVNMLKDLAIGVSICAM